jgi:murein DD-endopeptidase MepM/ murein hydrolase activator NlpD
MKPTQDLGAVLRNYKIGFHPIVPFDAQKDNLLRLDFTEHNGELTTSLLSDTKKFSDYIFLTLKKNNARYGIGGYNEHRSIYSISPLFDQPVAAPQNSFFTAGNDAEDHQTNKDDVKWEEAAEPRRLHLGIDIWGKPYTKVFAPLDGVVHSFAFNHNNGDYGATIILVHQLEGFNFHTLYGHLSLASITNLSEGQLIQKGEVFAEFGIPQENGNWPPHLHFQLIKDIGGMKGDYPGVCRLSESHSYLQNCPDPDLMLHMIQFATEHHS